MQATAFVDMTRQSASGNVATKGDIVGLKADLKGDIADLKADLKGDIADLKAGLKTDIARMEAHIMAGLLVATGIIIAAMGIMLAAFRFLEN